MPLPVTEEGEMLFLSWADPIAHDSLRRSDALWEPTSAGALFTARHVGVHGEDNSQVVAKYAWVTTSSADSDCGEGGDSGFATAHKKAVL